MGQDVSGRPAEEYANPLIRLHFQGLAGAGVCGELGCSAYVSPTPRWVGTLGKALPPGQVSAAPGAEGRCPPWSLARLSSCSAGGAPARRRGPGELSCPWICAGCRGRAAATSSFADSPLFLTGFPTPSACCGITFPGNCMPLVLGIGDEMGWPPGRGHLLGTGHPCSPKKAQHVTPSAPGPRRKDSRHGCSLCC